MGKKKARLIIDKQEIDLNIIEGTMGINAIDTTPLNSKNSIHTYDPGFMSTASCSSAITYVDGDKSELLYRGHPIEQLAEKCDFLDVSYLLMNGELPNSREKEKYTNTINQNRLLHDQLNNVFRGFRRDAHPMAVMVGVVGSMSAFYFDNMNVNNKNHRKLAADRLLAKMPTIAAWSYTYSLGLPFVYPQNDLSHSGNFLNMMFSSPNKKYKNNSVLTKALEKILILHADHEQNASTSTVRLVGSSGANPYACIAAGIASLGGPAHGGANEATLKMLHEIKNETRISEYIKRAKDKDDDFRLMGFGHRIYRNKDPRSIIMKQTCHEVLDELNIEAKTFPDKVGIWVIKSNNIKLEKEEKIGAIGLRIKKWVTYHGLSFNLNPDLIHYQNIEACGLPDYKSTSLLSLGIKISQEKFDKMYLKYFIDGLTKL